uniref:Uncharacterized protein n=1 Tax=viral metagenome TaxID=1070528 RepID=A0A6M3LNI3_9ZZZZ
MLHEVPETRSRVIKTFDLGDVKGLQSCLFHPEIEFKVARPVQFLVEVSDLLENFSTVTTSKDRINVGWNFGVLSEDCLAGPEDIVSADGESP